MEIKYRGKSKFSGEWAYGYYVHLKGHDYIIKDCESEANKEYQVWYEVLPDSVSRYTGLKDQSGNEIYDKDIGMLDDAFMCVVSWDGEAPGFALKATKGGKSRPLNTELADKLDLWGNAIDTPEALEI